MRLALAFALALGSAAGQPPTADEQKSVAVVARAGGTAEIDPKLPAAARVSAKFEKLTDSALLALKAAPHVGALDAFDATACTAKGYAALKELPHLRKLALGSSNLTATSAAHLAECGQLRTLYIARSGLNDVEIVPLKKLVLLEALDLSENPKVTDAGMETVKALERLRALDLAKTGITDKGLAELKGLDGLRNLSVGGTKVTADAAERFVDQMPNLRTIRR